MDKLSDIPFFYPLFKGADLKVQIRHPGNFRWGKVYLGVGHYRLVDIFTGEGYDEQV